MDHPLNEQHYQEIVKALDTIKSGLSQVALAKQAELDVGNSETELIAARDKLLKIKNVYFPGR